MIGIDVILSERTAGRGGEKLHRRAGLRRASKKEDRMPGRAGGKSTATTAKKPKAKGKSMDDVRAAWGRRSQGNGCSSV